jgi:hypothetical protein
MKQTSVTIMEKVAQHRNIIALEDVSTTNTSITRTSIDPPVVDATTSLSTSNKLFLQDFIPVLQGIFFLVYVYFVTRKNRLMR